LHPPHATDDTVGPNGGECQVLQVPGARVRFTGMQPTCRKTKLSYIDGHQLGPGSYKLEATPSPSPHTGKTVSVTFTVS
jgi:hypothetical protein